MALPLAGCAIVHVGDQNDGERTVRTHIGITRILMAETTGVIAATDVSTLGFGWDQGPFLGWRSGNWITADPCDCQLVVIIRSEAELENAANVLESIGGQNPCIANFSGTSVNPQE